MRILVALLTALLFTGCTVNVGGGEATETPSVSAESSTIPTPDNETAFLNVTTERYPEFDNAEGREALVSFAQGNCEILDAGGTLNDIFSIIADVATTDAEFEMFGFVTGAGISTFCPQHEHLIDELQSETTI